ncbi:MAG: response regulator [bacterium]|nr:response regulator [bacterium]
MTEFNEQVKLYNDAVIFGEEGISADVGVRAEASQGALTRMMALIGEADARKYGVPALVTELAAFTADAGSLYARMLRDIGNEALKKEAADMNRRTEKLRRELTFLTEAFSGFLKSELEDISNAGRSRRYWIMGVLFFVIAVSIFLVSILVRRSITRPLQKAAALASAMAAGDLSRKLDIRQQDEIGGLARAMNTMAEKIEASHALLEQKVAERTVSLKETNVKLREEISQHKRTEEELKKTRDKLVETARLADAANKSKSEFLANMSHEIRTPLTGVIGMTEMLMYTSPSNEQKDFIETLNVSSETLLAIINDILDMSKIEAGEFALASEAFDIKQAVNGVRRLLTPQAEKKNLELPVHFQENVSYRVIGDQVRFRQIIFNLAGNAVKFTHEGAVAIRVKCESQDETTSRFHISVEDTGIGIDADSIDCIFDKFTQVDSSNTRRYGGTGLGLPVTRQLVEIMGGSIKVESIPGKGSVFHVFLSLPSDTDTQDAAIDPVREAIVESKVGTLGLEDSFRLSILLAEDNKINQKLSRTILNRAGYSLDIVENGKEAVEKVKSGAYDLVLMDIQMPVMNGLDATRAIRKAGYTDIPIIAMTAGAFDEDRQLCLDTGMNDFLAKPLKQADLLKIIVKWMDKIDKAKNISRPQIGSAVLKQLEKKKHETELLEKGIKHIKRLAVAFNSNEDTGEDA